MKKIILLSTLTLLVAVFISSCTRNAGPRYDENYWLTQERGDVVYGDSYCGYYVVETVYGYTILRAIGTKPYEYDVMYGDFGRYGSRDFYNYSAGIIVRSEVVEYDLTYAEAQLAIDYYCPYGKDGAAGKSSTEGKKIINSGKTHITRPGSSK